MIEKPRIFGAAYSVYVRIVRLALLEKGVGYDHTPVDIFAAEGPPASYRLRHPFDRIPAFEHAGFALYETGAITRYIDEAFEGPALQPTDVRERARCNQLVSMADNYVYPQLVWGVYVERVSKPRRGEATNESKFMTALAAAEICLKAMADIKGDAPWLAGSRLTLADLYAAPMFAYFLKAEEGRDMLRKQRSLAVWWSKMAERPSMRASDPD